MAGSAAVTALSGDFLGGSGGGGGGGGHGLEAGADVGHDLAGILPRPCSEGPGDSASALCEGGGEGGGGGAAEVVWAAGGPFYSVAQVLAAIGPGSTGGRGAREDNSGDGRAGENSAAAAVDAAAGGAGGDLDGWALDGAMANLLSPGRAGQDFGLDWEDGQPWPAEVDLGGENWDWVPASPLRGASPGPVLFPSLCAASPPPSP